MCAVRFRDVESARAAFALGQVVYRCLFCGGEHVSGTQDGRWCLNSARQYWGWKFVRQPVPPEPAHNVGLAYRFVVAAYTRVRNRLQNCPEEADLPEYVLALDPRCDLRVALAQVAAEEDGGARRAVEEVWEAYRRLWFWLDSLAGYRPPCELVSAERRDQMHVAGEVAVLESITVRPAVPCPFPGTPELIRVSSHRYVALEPLLYAGYGPVGFGAVSVSGMEVPLDGGMLATKLTARVHLYSSNRVLEQVLPVEPGGSADAFAELLGWVCSATGAPGYEELMQNLC